MPEQGGEPEVREEGVGPRLPSSLFPGPASWPAGRVVAVGIDIADVRRVRETLARHGRRFTRRLLSPDEESYCLSRPDPATHVAARFAAKEAVIKCLGGGCALSEIEVVRALSGFPSIALHGRALERAAGCRVLISLSHLEDTAAAFAVLVAPEPDVR